MGQNVSGALAAAETLTVAERQELIERLIARMDDAVESERAPAVLSEAWRLEIARRSTEYDAGRTDTASWQEDLPRWKSRTKTIHG
jgi:putative addiction module component (TIGR02574 family)